MSSGSPDWIHSLKVNPSIAISAPASGQTELAGPEHKVQFVIELVGTRSCPASAGRALVQPRWHQALGRPQVYCMAPADRVWREMPDSDSGSYDSVALAWDLVSTQGELTSAAASQLLRTTESFASHIQRRAMSLPPPADVDRMVRALKDVRENLDVGVEILLVPKGAEFLERRIWECLAAMGFDLNEQGFFQVPKAPSTPILEVLPMGGASQFSLGAAHQDVRHPGLMIGFSVPLSANPRFALDAAFKTTDYLSETLDCVAYAEGERVLDPAVKAELAINLDAAVGALTNSGIRPGSRAAELIFGS